MTLCLLVSTYFNLDKIHFARFKFKHKTILTLDGEWKNFPMAH